MWVSYFLYAQPSKITMGAVHAVNNQRCSAWGFDSWGLTPKILSRLASLRDFALHVCVNLEEHEYKPIVTI